MKQISLVLTLVCMAIGTALSQRTVVGTVTDAGGEPLIGATVQVKATAAGTVTDFDGKYQIAVPAGSNALIFSYTGYQTREIELGASNVVNVTLEEGITLETAVVTALGISREKKALGYSVGQVDGDAVVNARETNLVNALAGKVAGVQITNSGGQTGASSRIVIRGISSFLGNNQPLFVIDGVPVDNSMTFGGGQNSINGTGVGDSPLFFGGTSNRLLDLDPSIVENISVLKGASATALYGKRGANGVVVITTKGGRKNQRPSVSVGFNYGWSNAVLPPLQSTYGQGVDGIFNPISNSAWGPRMDTLRFDANGQVDPNGTPAQTYNNAEEFYRTGQSRDLSISLDGGSDKSSYLFSYNNKEEEGIVYNNDMSRHNFMAKYDAFLSDKLMVGASFNYARNDVGLITEGNGLQSYQWTVYGAPVNYNLRNDNGDGKIGPEDYLNPDGTQRLFRTGRNNPYFLIDNNRLNSLVNRFIPNLRIQYQLFPWLTIANRLGGDIYTDSRRYNEAVGTLGTYQAGRLYEDIITYRQVNNDLTLQGERRLSDNFGIDYLVGHNVNDLYDDRLYTQGTALSIPKFYNIQNAAQVTSTQVVNHSRTIGVYGSFGIDFRRYLYLNFTARNDWSSTLPKENNSYFYPSTSLSFILTDAIPSLQGSTLSFLKLRGSWAQVGNDAGPYNTTETVYVQSNIGDGQRGEILIPYNGTNGYGLSNIIGNPNLVNELTTEIEFGLEAQLFVNRLRLEGSFYDRVTDDQIFNAPVAASIGAISRIVNAGSMRNKGFEVVAEVVPVRGSGFEWSLTGTFTKNKNTVEELTPGVDNIRLGGFTTPGIYIVKDYGYGVIWGSRYLRDDQGRVIIDDDSSSPRYGLPVDIDPNLGAIGQTQPDWLASLRNTFSYGTDKFGRLSISAVFDKREGGDILNFDNFYLNFYGITKQTEDRDGSKTFVYPNAVKSDGSVNDIEVPYDQTYWRLNWGVAFEDLIEDGSFLRFRELTMAYSLPTTLFDNWKSVKGIGLSVTGRNLFLDAPNFTGSDPEVSVYGNANGQGFYNFNTPATKSWNVAVNVTF